MFLIVDGGKAERRANPVIEMRRSSHNSYILFTIYSLMIIVSVLWFVLFRLADFYAQLGLYIDFLDFI